MNLQPGSVADWAGAGANLIVAAIAVAAVFIQQGFERRRELSRIASAGVSAAANAFSGLQIVNELEAAIEASLGSSSLDKAGWRFRLEVATSTIRVAIGYEHRDPALVRALIEAQAWVDYALAHIDDPMWLWSHLPTNTADRTELVTRLQRMSAQLLRHV